MAALKVKRVKINDDWFDVSDTWVDGGYKLSRIWSSVSYTLREPYDGVYHVYNSTINNSNNCKVGEINVSESMCYGWVKDFELGPKGESSGWLSALLTLIFSNWGGRTGILIGIIVAAFAFIGGDGINHMPESIFASLLFASIVGTIVGAILGGVWASIGGLIAIFSGGSKKDIVGPIIFGIVLVIGIYVLIVTAWN